MDRSHSFLLVAALSLLTVPASAQAPNTSTVVVIVTDQSGGVIKDARVAVANTQTGSSREVMTGDDGSAGFPALSLTGTYVVTVAKDGFGTEERRDIILRAGETATVRMKLLVQDDRNFRESENSYGS